MNPPHWPTINARAEERATADRPLGSFGICKECLHANSGHTSDTGCTTPIGYDKATTCACTEGMS